jgi:subtilisin-like proprotein convertase family protein
MFRRPRPGSRPARRNRTARPTFLRSRKPLFEQLEDRRLMAVFTVTNIADAGAGSFRQALIDANNAPNVGGVPDDIQFNIAGAGVHTIQPLSQLPPITEAAAVNGYSQPGSVMNNFTGSLNTVLTIELNGALAGASDGLRILSGGSGSTVRGLAINGFQSDGIEISDSDNNIITGNFIGTNVAGNAASANGLMGVFITGDSDTNRIGGNTPAERNLISANTGSGIEINGTTASSNTILGNLIGLNAAGTGDLGNTLTGVSIIDSGNNTIGGTSGITSRNIISGNNSDGLFLFGPGVIGNVVSGNYIGTDHTGNNAVGNRDGVRIMNFAANNTIGGTTSAAANTISGNPFSGVRILNAATNNLIQGNFIGSDFAGSLAVPNGTEGVVIQSGANNNLVGGSVAGAGNTIAFNSQNGVAITDAGTTGNRIQRNSIRNNALLGIDLGDDGFTPNDVDDPDGGPNLLQNLPVFIGTTTLLGNSISLAYRVDSTTANQAYPLTVEFFVADSANQEGRTFLASDSYTAGQSQTNKSIVIPAPALLTNQFLVATATDANGNTSEFSFAEPIALPVILGSEPTVIRNGEIIFQDDIDQYQYIAHSTGKTVVRIDFLHDLGNLDLEIRDQFGNLLAPIADNSTSDDNFEEIVIPTVGQQKYFIRVVAVGFGIEQSNVYNLEVENFPAPVPSGVHLDPLSDTGMMNNDNVTSDTTPTFFIQTDVLNFVDTNGDGFYTEHDPLPVNAPTEDSIDALTAAEANRIQNGTPNPDDRDGGIAVEMTLVNTTTGSTTSLTRFADPVILVSPEVYRFAVEPADALAPGVYLVSARTKVFDGQGNAIGGPNQKSGRSNASPPLWVTISADSPTGGTFNLLASSDTGMFNNDNVTNKMSPAFSGQGSTNAKVNVFAQAFDTAGNPVGGPLLIGNGLVGSDATDGIAGNGLGLWEVTVEPMADGKYNFFARFETGAGVVGDPVALTTALTNDTDFPIPSGGQILSPITIPEVQGGTIVDVNVRVNITHTNDADLGIFLIHPDGTSIELSSGNGGSGDNYTNAIFDDAAGIGITAGVAPFTGTFRPEVPLAGLNGKQSAGLWGLRVVDAAGNEAVGTLLDWSLTVETPLMVVIDTVEPNTPYLDLLDDAGRSDVDNITKDNTPQVSMTTSDPNIAFSQLLFTDNLKFRIYNRYESAAEFLLYDSALDAIVDANNTPGDMFTSLTRVFATLPEQFFSLFGANAAVLNVGGIGVLADGVHNLKLEVEDRAGNISHDFLLTISVDTATPPVSFGLPDVASITDGLAADSDSGVTTVPAAFADRITNDTTPRLWGRAEADTIVRAFLDRNGNGIIDLLTDTFLGQTTARPYDGNDAYPDGHWEITSVLDLNQIVGLPKDGLRQLLVTAEDQAGNPMPMNNEIRDGVDTLQIFLDTQGPQVTAVTVNNLSEAQYDLFDPKPSVTGTTPLVNSLKIALRDLPNRVAADFLYVAIVEGIAETVGNYLVVGDHVGTVAIQSVVATLLPAVNGQPATATIELFFASPLPDDRYTFTISDNLVDPAGNKLDGESNADEPTDVPTFPSGDGVPGGSFIARFTIDSRPEIGSYVSQNVNIDVNGNFVWDPANGQIGNDATNVDISWTLPVANADGSVGLGGFNVHDLLFAGKFRPLIDEVDGAGAGGGGPIVLPRYFDQLAAFGNSAQEGGIFRWIIDTNSDGVVTIGTDVKTTQPLLGNFNVSGALPVAGNFDNNLNNGDEIGLYNSGKWGLDFNHNFVIEAGEVISTGLFGRPIVGDFDGDGQDDLAVFNNNQFFFDFAAGGFGVNNAVLVWGFPGVLDQPVAADMDQDGIDDVGLWVPRTSATPPSPLSQWYFLVSNDPNGNLRTTGTINRLNHAFTPTPFGKDLYAEFGDDRSMPIVGNFDPPVAPRATNSAIPLAGDYDGNGRVEQADYTVWRSNFGSRSNLAADGNTNGVVDSADYSIWRNNMGAVSSAALTLAVTGDFDGSGQVSTADYGPWKTSFGSTTNLAADSSGNGRVDAADYTRWRDSLGAVSASGSGGASGSVSSDGSGGVAAFFSVESTATQIGLPATPFESQSVSQAETPSLLLIAALSPTTSTDDALEAFGAERLTDDEASTTQLDESTLAAVWQSWDEF